MLSSRLRALPFSQLSPSSERKHWRAEMAARNETDETRAREKRLCCRLMMRMTMLAMMNDHDDADVDDDDDHDYDGDDDRAVFNWVPKVISANSVATFSTNLK